MHHSPECWFRSCVILGGVGGSDHGKIHKSRASVLVRGWSLFMRLVLAVDGFCFVLLIREMFLQETRLN
jgi:hypothetical protein